MEIKARAERQDDGWLIAVPSLGNFKTTSKRLDKATEQIKVLAEKQRLEQAVQKFRTT